MSLQHVLLAILWIIYCALHSLLAGLGLKTRLRKKMGDGFKYYRIFYTVFAFAGLAGLVIFQLSFNSPLVFRPAPVTGILAVALAAPGLFLMLVCIRKYFFSLSGLRSLFVENASPQLIITGVHRYVRHPLYLGTFMFIWGLWLLAPTFSFLIVDVIITVYTLIGILLEERKLVAEFGEDYRSYQQNVPKLLPRRTVRR